MVFWAMILHYKANWITWVNEMNFVMNHAPGARSIARPVGQQSSAIPLYHRSLPFSAMILMEKDNSISIDFSRLNFLYPAMVLQLKKHHYKPYITVSENSY